MDFKLSDCTVSLANALRRIALSEIDTFAIDSVVFYENSSSFFDEYLSNRLCLIPIKTDLRAAKKEEIVFTLDAQGPGTIHSGELKSTDSKIIVANEKIPILKMMEKQVLRLEAKAKLGNGKEHAKYQACLITYGYDDKKKVFDFHMESFGQLTTKQILNRTIEILETKIDGFEKGMKN